MQEIRTMSAQRPLARQEASRARGVRAKRKSDKPIQSRMPRLERRAHLLSVARAIINECGSGGLTMSAMAIHAGVSKPVVYDHFENSDAVVLAILLDYFDEHANFVVARVKDAADIFEYVELSIDAIFDFRRANPLKVDDLIQTFSSSAMIRELNAKVQKRSIMIYRALLEQGGLPKNKSLQAAFILKEMVVSATIEFTGSRGERSARTTLKAMARAAIGAILEEGNTKPAVPKFSRLG